MNDNVGYKCLTKEDLLTLSKSEVPIPENEALRIFTLKQTELLDSDSSDPSFDRFATLAQRLFKVPIALVSLVDIDRQWFKANVGLEAVSQTHRNLAFCAYTVLPDSPDVFVIEDALLDYRFKNSPLVLGEPYIRFYAGAAIIINDVKIGSLCIIDRVPHMGFTETDRMNMLDLGAAVSNLVRERRDALLRTNQECAKMMSDMMRKVRAPLCSIALNAETLLTNVARSRSKHGKPADFLPESVNSHESSSTPITDVEEIDEETSHIMTNLSTAVAQLNIIIESSICLGDFVLEKVESDKKEWASFTTANILETVAVVRKTLKNMEMSTKITWDIDSSQLSLGNRHVYSPKATSFILLNSVEQLSLHWRNVLVKVSFQDTINEEYECIIQQLDDAPICDIESTWNQGLLQIEFMLSDKRDKSGYEDDDDKGSESSQGYLSFYSLQQVLKDVEGGCTVLDTGSSYAQSMRVWMPCAIIMIDQRASRSIGFDSLSLSTSPGSTRDEIGEMSFPVVEESKLVGINGSDLQLGDYVSDFVKVDSGKPIQKKTIQAEKVAELYVSEAFSPGNDNIHDIGSERYKKKEVVITAPVLSLIVDKDNNTGSEKLKRTSFQDDTGESNTPTKSEITRIKKLHVLLVEDTLTQQKLMGKWLNGQGCIVTFALNGKVGLELLKTKKFDLCFMDFLMPVMTGADAIANLNSWCIANTPSSCSNLNWWINKEMMIVGLSSNAREDELVKAFENGMHFFCPKPVETSMLASILKMTRDAPSLKIALKEIGQQAVRLESPNSGIISASSTINRDSRMQVRVKDKSNGNQRFAEVSSEDGVQETCTGQSQDVIVRKGKTGWKLFKKISKLLTGGRINPDSETSSIKSKNHEENKHNDEDDLGHIQEE